MIVGVPKEVKTHEYRVGLTPTSVRELVAHSHQVVIEASGLGIPDPDDWEIPIVCFRCSGEYAVAFRYFRAGVVFYCPHCQASFVPLRSTYLEITAALERFSQRWEQSFAADRSDAKRPQP